MARIPTSRVVRHLDTSGVTAETALLLGRVASFPSNGAYAYVLQVCDLDRAVRAALTLGAVKIRVELCGDFDCDDGDGVFNASGDTVIRWGTKWATAIVSGEKCKVQPCAGEGFFIVSWA